MSQPKDIDHAQLELVGLPRQRKSAEEFLATFETGKVPTGAGCYIMMDVKGKPIYVGKAKNLRARIRTYMNQSDSRYSVQFLMKRVARIDFLVTNTEKEALLLENSLIKQHKPRYNVQLKDDKTYISLRLNLREDFPRLTVVRRYRKDGAKYFGPYHSAASVRQTLRQLQQMFPLRTCTDHVLNNRTRPCLYYQMKQCCAPCVDYVDREAYHEIVQQVVMILEGRSGELENALRGRIQELAGELRFEEAAVLRDRIQALHRTTERQRTVDVSGQEERDVFGLYNEGAFTEIQILFYRGGKMLGGRTFSFKHREMPEDELVGSFLLQYYSEAPVIPREILVPVALEDGDVLGELLSEQRGGRVVVACPQRGEKRALVGLAIRNAQSSFEDKQLADKANRDTLEQLQQALKLPKFPERIECFDISTIQGTNTVGSMVTFDGGEANKSRYRRFSIRNVEGQDDFASMREVMMRRYTRGIAENDLPDFVVVDGGKGQLGVATAVFKDLGIEDLPHAGIAKARTLSEGGRSEERFFMPGRLNPVLLPQSGPVVRLMARIRDEAHRFAITYHRKKRGKAALGTTLTKIPGVGPQRARTLLKSLGSLAKVKTASAKTLAAVPGISEELAYAVYAYFHPALDKDGGATAG
jgi:excinuclease ABC subunit C